ncbi:cytochrome c(L), periplasmic [Rhodovulum sulfidophilum]|uniref:Cytochrome c-L n=1 Tax=Rhodovulum visakhapatnamense TaxID=364297 RepID=A0ABS1RE01_9RHOB|nr:cytochrome c(L), periplasmic [Rhodovulum visakhapatnamense]MBL3569761.1 cytochrome c(L), periplasmic [Rhodovulum visakhapatnamense]MBL3577843.1 cytochrome c(L), periplasmic [Rhodovulum visakhapatnamense]OLS42328.1 cytochrome c(L), periplasmic [Rhodovulum sulfidophilum]
MRPSVPLFAAVLCTATALAAFPAPRFYHTVEGTPLDFDLAMEEGRETEAVETFMETGINIYNEDPDILPDAESLFASMCSGCHGHYGEGKIGPGLNDDYWTYPRNEEDVGLFSTLFGGATGQMGPMWGKLTLDEMLRVMAWVRHLYTGAPETAFWLTSDKRASFTPFDPGTREDGGL